MSGQHGLWSHSINPGWSVCCWNNLWFLLSMWFMPGCSLCLSHPWPLAEHWPTEAECESNSTGSLISMHSEQAASPFAQNRNQVYTLICVPGGRVYLELFPATSGQRNAKKTVSALHLLRILCYPFLLFQNLLPTNPRLSGLSISHAPLHAHWVNSRKRAPEPHSPLSWFPLHPERK